VTPSTIDTAAALAAAWTVRHPGTTAPANAVVLPLAQSVGAEGSLSSYFEGTNNLGAMHAGSHFAAAHAQDVGYGMVAFLDHAPGGGAYIARMAVYPTLALGAGALLDLVERYVDLANVKDASDYAAQLYAHNYFEGFHAPATAAAARPAAYAAGTWTDADRANIADYAAAISRSVPTAQAAYDALGAYTGDPNAVTVGPPFAELGARLTPAPSYAPHTVDHARELLGASGVDPPPGGVSIADCLASPSGDGVWLFPLPSVQAPSSRSVFAARAAEIALSAALGIVIFSGARMLLPAVAPRRHRRPPATGRGFGALAWGVR
jgi:hypothetical protein